MSEKSIHFPVYKIISVFEANFQLWDICNVASDTKSNEIWMEIIFVGSHFSDLLFFLHISSVLAWGHLMQLAKYSDKVTTQAFPFVVYFVFL